MIRDGVAVHPSDRLGEGTPSIVYRGTLRQNRWGLPAGCQLAVKVYKEWALDEPNQLKRITREFAAAQRLVHPNVIRSFALLKGDPPWLYG
jgi:hypothetical protein